MFSKIRITILLTVDLVILFLSGNSRSVIKENDTSLEDLPVKDVFILVCVTFIFKGSRSLRVALTNRPEFLEAHFCETSPGRCL